MFKINNKNITTMSLTLISCTFSAELQTIFTPFSSVSIDDFKQVNLYWEINWFRSHWIQDFFSDSYNKIFIDSETLFWISKHFFRFWNIFFWFWNIFLNSEIVFSIPKFFSRFFFSQFHNFFLTLKIFSRFQVFFLDSEIFFSVLNIFSWFWKFFVNGGYWPP